MYDGLGYLMADHISLFVDIHQTAECQAVFPCIQRADTIGQLFWKHGDHPVNQIDTGTSF